MDFKIVCKISCILGKVIKVSLAFGFIQRDYAVLNRSENVFFDLPACGLGPNDDLADVFELNDR